MPRAASTPLFGGGGELKVSVWVGVRWRGAHPHCVLLGLQLFLGDREASSGSGEGKDVFHFSRSSLKARIAQIEGGVCGSSWPSLLFNPPLQDGNTVLPDLDFVFAPNESRIMKSGGCWSQIVLQISALPPTRARLWAGH